LKTSAGPSESVSPRSREAAAHGHATRISIDQIAQFLLENLGGRLAGFIADVDPKTIQRWASGEQAPRQDAERKIRAAFQIFHVLMQAESPATIRAWFIGMNPQIEDLSPSEAIAEGRLREALAAARAFKAGG